MRKRELTKEQMIFIIDNNKMSNKELADKLNTKASIIATYKYRARKAGIDLPKYKQWVKIENSVSGVFGEIARERKVSE